MQTKTRIRSVGVSALLGAWLLSGQASAQQAAALVPVVTPIRSDDLLDSAHGPRADALFTPLRLTLTGGLFPVSSVLPGCASREDASGNAVHGFALQHYAFLRVTPQLVLHGFSMDGCAVDAGLGGGLTYNVPLGKSLWLVPSAGFYALPSPGGSRSALVTSSARIDLVKRLGWGRTLSFGLGVRQRGGSTQTNAVSFGGTF